MTDEKISFPIAPSRFPKGFIVADYLYRNKSVMYYGNRAVKVAYSQDGTVWKPVASPVLQQPIPIEVAGAFLRDRGILLIYYEKTIVNHIPCYSAYCAFFDKKNPEKLIFKTNQPVWRQTDHWPNRQITPIGCVFLNHQLITYWQIDDLGVFAVVIAGFRYDPTKISGVPIKLTRRQRNPIIKPNPENDWEAFTTFNPAALYADKKVHILYRAQGYDYISSVGYAVSPDGVHISHRSNQPVYYPTARFETNKTDGVNLSLTSGGGWGGCEDPRVTQIDDRVYMVYVAFDGWSNLRLALTSILLEDFLNQRWLWTKPILISPPGVIDKSGCLLPEKIQGKYVFFHRVFPNILIDFVDNLEFDGKTRWLTGQYQIKVRPGYWDSRKIGAGAPPLKTKDGWLLIYYGVDDKDASRYQIGAMLLDINDPTKVLYRSNQPILKPIADYENNGFKPGIVYPCGAVVVNNQLLVYYGAADSYVCVAAADLNQFLNQLKTHQPTELHPIQIKEVVY